MEQQEESLMKQLEDEGMHIACLRKELNDMINDGKHISCQKIVRLCRHLNEHIDAFDRIDDALSKAENPELESPKLKAVGL